MSDAPLGRSYRLLVVDDDAMVRSIARRILAPMGMDILEAADGPSALALAEQDPREIDLLVTDVVMPLMRGPALFAHLRASRPALPVLYMSGYGPSSLESVEGEFLQKPFTPATLRESVERAILRGKAP